MKKSGLCLKRPELLSPAGSFEALRAAAAGGADAVYFGSGRFNARANAKNFDSGEAVRALSFCKNAGVKAYITFNTLLYDNELPTVFEEIQRLWQYGADAFIVADLGLIKAVSESLPEIRLHASTQMTVVNAAGVEYVRGLGIKRAVLARELSLDEITRISAGAGCETEIFIHGALCVCWSGQCLMSSFLGGRSANRGTCAQPCRLPYKNGKTNPNFPLSLKDLSLADKIPELLESGAASFKIEGRMKSPEYVYAVTGVYRHLIDERRRPTEAESRLLEGIFSRSGHTVYFFGGKVPPAELHGLFGVRRGADKRETRSADVKIPDTSRFDRPAPEIKIKTVPFPYPKGDLRRKSNPYEIFIAAGGADHGIPLGKYVFYPERFLDAALRRLRSGGRAGAILDRVTREGDMPALDTFLSRIKKEGMDTIICRNIGQIGAAAEHGMSIYFDSAFNVFNSPAARSLQNVKGMKGIILSCELNMQSARRISGDVPVGVTVYGRIPLMENASCAAPCGKCGGGAVLRDRLGVDFPIQCDKRSHSCVIYNSVPLNLCDRMEDVRESGADFIVHRLAEVGGEDVENLLNGRPPKQFTRGLFYKRV